MELIQASSKSGAIDRDPAGSNISRSNAHFISANTKEVILSDLKKDCVIPVFAKDNESIISHPEFIHTILQEVERFFAGEQVLQPAIKVSHAIKGRIPEAMGKPAKYLIDSEKTLYYERMAFVIEVPGISRNISCGLSYKG